MAQVVVRRIEEDVKERLQRRALQRGVSMEEEVRSILREAVMKDAGPARGLGSEIAALFQDVPDQDEPLPGLPDQPFQPARPGE